MSAFTRRIIKFWGSFERVEFLDQPSVSAERTSSVERRSPRDSCVCNVWRYASHACTGLFISPSGISEFDCATTKTDTAERSISINREFLQVFFL